MIVALEMAHQLKDLGREVVLLVVIDWAPRMIVKMSGWRHILRLAHRAVLWIKAEKAQGNGSFWSLAIRACENTGVLASRMLDRTKRSPLDVWKDRKTFSRTHVEFMEAFHEQLVKYEPKRPYDGRVLVVVAGSAQLFHLSIVKESWARIARRLEVFWVKGATHETMMTMPYVGLVANHLRKQLNSIGTEAPRAP